MGPYGSGRYTFTWQRLFAQPEPIWLYQTCKSPNTSPSLFSSSSSSIPFVPCAIYGCNHCCSFCNNDPLYGVGLLAQPQAWRARVDLCLTSCTYRVMLRVVTVSSVVVLHPSQSQWDGTVICMVMQATRDTQSPLLNGENKSSQASPTAGLKPRLPEWQVSVLRATLLHLLNLQIHGMEMVRIQFYLKNLSSCTGSIHNS